MPAQDNCRCFLGRDPAFAGEYSLLATDQGVRGFLQVSNDVSFDLVEQLDILSWLPAREGAATMFEEVAEAIDLLDSVPSCSDFISNLSESMARFDWRTLATPKLTEEERNRQALYRTGTGYREVRRQLLSHLMSQPHPQIAESASQLTRALGF